MAHMTVAQRLGIRPGNALWFEPVEWLHVLGPLPPGVHVTGEFAAATVAVLFVSNAGSVRWFVDRYRTVMTMPHAVWVCYPTAGRSDFTRATLNTMLGGHGLVTVEEVPLDAAWTALHVRHLSPGAPSPVR